MMHDIRGTGAWRWLAALLMLTALVLPQASASASSSSLLSRVATAGTVTGGREVTVKVYLNTTAPAGGVLVLMSSSSPLVPVPPTIVVPGGATQGSVRVVTKGTAVNTVVTITARSGAGVKSTSIMIREPYLSSLSVQTVIRAEGLGRVTVRLSGVAPSGGVTVSMASDQPGILPVPATVVIPAGSSSVVLKLPAGAVETEVAVSLTASYDGRTISKPTVVRNMS